MEKMEPTDSNEITFVLDEKRFQVDKEKLMKKSQYFSALFSGKYSDSASTEFPIKLKWTKKNLLAFIYWINENEEYDDSYYTDLATRFKHDLISDIVELVEIANYFVVDKLVQDLKDIIIKYHLYPRNALYLYLHVRNQPLLKDLHDLSFAMCVQRFDRLPRSELLELSYEDFMYLVGNVNLQCEKEFLKTLMTDWLYFNHSKLKIDSERFYKMMRIILNDVSMTKNHQDILQCAVSYRDINHENGRVLIVYTWNGISMKETLIHMPFENNIKKILNGARVLFRGFDMYLIGGQFAYRGFNTEIWKYSFLTKQWYCVTRMPQALRHMTVVFWDSRLYLIGGTGRYRLKFENQIYYDIDTDKWSEPEPIEGFFTGQSLACSVRDKIFVLRSLPYFFYPESGNWTRLSKRSSNENEQLPITEVKSVLSYDDTILFLSYNNSYHSEIWTMSCDDRHLKKVESTIRMDSIVVSKNEIIGFLETSNCIYIMTLYISSDDNKIRSQYCYRYSLNHYKKRSWQDVYLGFFNLLNPRSLYNMKPDLYGLM